MHPFLFKGPTILLVIGCKLQTLWVCVLLASKAVLMVLLYVRLYYGVVLYLLYAPFCAVSY